MFNHKPFQEGDIVVANGWRLAGGRDHFFGTEDDMEVWEEEGTPLEVLSASYEGDGAGWVAVTDEQRESGEAYDYHPLELSHAD